MSGHEQILRHIAHRPWPLPETPWIMFQSWQQQLFAHWRVPVQAMRGHVPAQLELDLFDGSAWLGMTPFRIRGLHLRGLPPLPVGSEFAELNLRTCVTVGGRPGVYFFSLDAASIAAVYAARAAYGLPYHHAAMQIDRAGDWTTYESRRVDGTALLSARYRPQPDTTPFTAEPGSIDHFLIERYALYVVRGGTVLRGDIHHPPWSLQAATATFDRNTIADAAGLELPAGAPLLHYSRQQDALIWPLTRALP